MPELQQITLISIIIGVLIIIFLLSLLTTIFLVRQKKQALEVMARGPLILGALALITFTVIILCFDMIMVVMANQLTAPQWMVFLEEQVPQLIKKILSVFTIKGLSIVVTYLIISASTLFVGLCISVYINWWLVTQVPNTMVITRISRRTQIVIGIFIAILIFTLVLNINIIRQFFAS